MKWTDIVKKVKSIGGKIKNYKKVVTISGIGLMALLGVLAFLPGTIVTTSGDIGCYDICTSYINITTEYNINITNIKEIGMNVYFNKQINGYNLYLKNDSGDWVTEVPTYIYRLKNTTWEFKLEGFKDPTQTIKWGIQLGGVNIDPLWYGTYYNCSTCEECNTDINVAPAGSTIRLNTSVTNRVGSCINFTNKDNLTFDCLGLTIDGDASGTDYGINMTASNDYITIRNCTIKEFYNGIQIDNGTWSNITYVNSSYNTWIGLRMGYENNSYVDVSTFRGNTYSDIYFTHCINNTIVNSTAYAGGSYNIFILDSSDYNYLNNITSNSGASGIRFGTGSSNNRVYNSITMLHSNRGIGVDGSGSPSYSYNNIFTNITSAYNTGRGFLLYGNVTGNIINNSNITGNTVYGIDLDSSGTLYITNCSIYNNILNNTVNVYSDSASNINYWNLTLDYTKASIVYGRAIGGNLWTSPTGNYSDSCTDTTPLDEICDSSYNPTLGTTDYLPLKRNTTFGLWINNYASNVNQEIGNNVNIYCRGSSYCCMSLNASDYGSNYSCGYNGMVTSFPAFASRNIFKTGDQFAFWKASGSKVIYLDKYISLLTGNYTLTWLNSNKICFQDTATSSTSCGGLSTGSYGSDGSWTALANTYDADWGTYGFATSGTANMYVNYTKPTNAINADWDVMGIATRFNTTIATNCWDAYPNVVVLKVASVNTGVYPVYGYCWDGSSWYQMWMMDEPYAGPYFAEEGLWWNIAQGSNTSVSTVTLDIGADATVDLNISGYSYGSQFNIDRTNATSENLTLVAQQKTIRYINLFKYANYTTTNISFTGYVNWSELMGTTMYTCTGDVTICPSTVDASFDTYNGLYQNICAGCSLTSKSYYQYSNYSVDNTTTYVNVTVKIHGGGGSNSFPACGTGIAWSNITVWNNITKGWEMMNYSTITGGCDWVEFNYMINFTLSTRNTYFNDSQVQLRTQQGITAYPRGVAEVHYYEAKIKYDAYPSVVIDLVNDRMQDYSNTSLRTKIAVEMNKTALNNYLTTANCNTYKQMCVVPITFYSEFGGQVLYSDINFTGTYITIPMNITPIRTYLDNSASYSNIQVPFTAQSSTWGALNMTSIQLDYNGTVTYNATAVNGTNSQTYLITTYWSNFSRRLPRLVQIIFFTPLSNTSQNVRPFGQTNTQPIINITTLANVTTFGLNLSLSSKPSCITLNMSNQSTFANQITLDTTSRTILTCNANWNTSCGGIWINASFACPTTTAYYLTDYLTISKCTGCV